MLDQMEADPASSCSSWLNIWHRAYTAQDTQVSTGLHGACQTACIRQHQGLAANDGWVCVHVCACVLACLHIHYVHAWGGKLCDTYSHMSMKRRSSCRRLPMLPVALHTT